MFKDTPNRDDFLFRKQMMYFKTVVRSGSKVKVLQVLFNLIIRVVDSIRNNKIIIRIREYVIRNWGAPFLVGFMVLLISSAFFLPSNFRLADTISVFAFYALTVGVVLQLVCFLKYGQKANVSEALS